MGYRPGDAEDGSRSFADYQRGPEIQERFCRGCQYPLKGLMSGLCPECGAPFSMTNPRTYLRSDELRGPLPLKVSNRAAKGFSGLLLLWGVPALIVGLSTRFEAIQHLAGAVCCGYAIGWPLLMIIGTHLVLDAMMGDRVSGVMMNILLAGVVGAVLAAGQWMAMLMAVSGVSYPSPLLLVVGVCFGPVVGIYRAYRST